MKTEHDVLIDMYVQIRLANTKAQSSNDPAVLRGLINGLYTAMQKELPNIVKENGDTIHIPVFYVGKVSLTDDFVNNMERRLGDLSELELYVVLTTGDSKDYIRLTRELKERPQLANVPDVEIRNSIHALELKGILHVQRMTEVEFHEQYAKAKR